MQFNFKSIKMEQIFYYLIGWFFAGFLGALFNEMEMYLKNIIISKRNRKKYFIELVLWGAFSFVVGFIHLALTIRKIK